MMSELRECPYCGSDATLEMSAVARVRCTNNFCAADSPCFALDSVDDLLRWWNRRASKVEEAALVMSRKADRSAERDRCAKVCEEIEAHWRIQWQEYERLQPTDQVSTDYLSIADGARRCAAEIRELK